MQRDAHDSPNRVLKIEVGLAVKRKAGSKSLRIYAFANSTRYFIINGICYVNVIQSIATASFTQSKLQRMEILLLPTSLYFYILDIN